MNLDAPYMNGAPKHLKKYPYGRGMLPVRKRLRRRLEGILAQCHEAVAARLKLAA